ncbi:MAG: tRNA (adenosine(37)-N6)-threonylcarbamoyltransferase complex dimerization subunit type 1 TsaB [Bacteroidales bacterium]|jgi:tRNA threonylcarbamoyladenosine biosynthesis protein TsaB|nr:tRNA (adenosine(37)-N6)-threonylcarbamoyltransferase complex dimerization subunit type 1 TsaB [Bacteroidales bacterium]
MGLILCLETATEVCSVALALDGNLLKIKESSSPNVHSSQLTLFIEEIVHSSEFTLSGLDAIAVSMGPGSYTGIRIGVSTAKGLCYALDKPLIAIPTLQSMAQGMKNHLSGIQYPASGISLICPMIDARRMEVYAAIYDSELNTVRETSAQIIDRTTFTEYLTNSAILFAGNGASKCKPFLEHHKNAVFIENFAASARFMVSFAEQRLTRKQFEDIAYFEPFYLKDFIPGKSKVKGLN